MTQPIDPLLDPSSSFGQASSPEPSIDPRVPNPTAPAIDPRVPQPTPASPAQLKAMRRAKVHGLKPVPMQPAPQAAPAPQPVPQQPVAGMPQPAPPSPIEQKARRAAYAISPSAAAVRADDPNMARLMDVQQAMFNPPPRQQAPWMGYGGGDVQKAMDEAWARKRQERIGAASPEEQAVLQQIRDLERPGSFTRMPETPKLPTTGEEIVAPLDVDEASADPIAYLKDRKSQYSQIENPLLREAALSYLDAATPHILGVPREQAEALARQYNRGKKLEYSDPAARAFREKAYAHLYEQDNLPDEERYEGPLTDKSESEKSLERRIEKEGKGTWGGLEARRQKLESFSRKREAIAQAEAAGALDLNRYIREELTPHFPRKEGETWAQWMNRLPDDVKDSVDEVTEQVAAERRRGQAAARAAARQASIEGAEQKYLPEIFVDAAARTLVTWGAGVARLAGAAGSDTGEQIADAMSEWGQEEELAPSQSEMMGLLEKKNFSQWLGKLTGISGEQAPNIAMALVGGGAGGALGKALNVSSRLAKGMQLVGGTLTIAPLEFESQFDESFMHNLAQGMGNEDAASAAMLEAGGYAVLASAFEAMPYSKFMGRGLPKRSLGERSWRKIVRGTIKQEVAEFGTEGIQATTSQLVRRFASDILGIEKPPMDWVAIAEEALTGAIFGFGVGGVTSVASEAAKQPVRDKTFARALDVVRSGRGLTVDTLSEEGRVQDIEGAVADPVNLAVRQAAAEEGMASFTKKQRQQLIDAQARLGDAPEGSPEWMAKGVAAARADMTAEQKEAAATAAREEYAEIGPVQFGTDEVVEVEASATEKSVLSRKHKMSKAEQDSAFQSIEDGLNKNREGRDRIRIKRADKLTKVDRAIQRIGEALGFQTLMYDASMADGRRTTVVAGMFIHAKDKQGNVHKNRKRTIAIQTGQTPLAGTATALHEVIGHGIRASGQQGEELYNSVVDSIVAMGESRPEAQRLVARAQKRYAKKAEDAKDSRDEIKLMEEAMGDIAIELASRILGAERATALKSLADASEPKLMARIADFFKSLFTNLGLGDGIKARTAESRERANAALEFRNMIQTFTGDKNIVAHLRKLNQLAETERTNQMRDQADPEAADAQVQAEQDAGEAAAEAAPEPEPEAQAEPVEEVAAETETAPDREEADLEAQIDSARAEMADLDPADPRVDQLMQEVARLEEQAEAERFIEPEPPEPSEAAGEAPAEEAQTPSEPAEAAEAEPEPQEEAAEADMSLQGEYEGYDVARYATPEQVKEAGVKAEDAKKTAISSKVEDGEAKTGTARTYQKLAKVIAPLSRVLDYGAGRAFGTQVLQEKGLNADAYELFQHDKPGVPYRYGKPEQVPAAMYDVVVSNAVLNVVPHETRMEILREMHRALKPGGRMYINVRQWSGDVSKAAGKAERLSDTEILTTTGSFQKGFVNEAELHDMIRQALPDVTVERQEGEPWHKAVVFKPSQSPQAWADFSQQAPELISEADVKLGDPKVALALLEKHGLVSPDYVRTLLGDKQPEYLDKVVEFMVKQRDKVKAGQLKPRDLAKAYIITVASQGSNSVKASTIKAKTGFNVKRIFQDGRGGVRPEEAAAAWLASRKGQTALNRLDRGDYRPDDWAQMFDVRKAYGDDRLNTNNVAGERVQVFPGDQARQGDEILTIPIEVEPTTVTKKIDGVNTKVEVFKWNEGVRRYEIRADAVRPDRVVAVRKKGSTKLNLNHIADMTAAVNEARGDVEVISKKLNKLSGIGDAKLPFIKHLLGFGDAATIDAVEINLWVTGQGDTKQLQHKNEQLDRMIRLFRNAQGSNKFQDQLFRQISDSLQTLIDSDTLNASVPKEYAMHILHHWVWDRAKGDETTHAGMMEVMADSSIQQPSEPIKLDRLSNDVIAQFKRSNDQFGKIKIPKAQRQEAEDLGLSTTDYRVAGSILEGDLTPSRVLGVKQYLMGELGPMETEGVNEKELVEGFRSSAEYMPQPSSDARMPLASFSTQAPDEATTEAYNASLGASLSTKGHRKERDNVAGKRTAIHKRVKGLRAPSGYEGAPANGSDFPEAVHRRSKQIHRRIKAAGRKVSQAMRTRDQALVAQALVDFLRNPEAAPASVRPAISSLMKDLAVVRERDLDRKTRVLDDSSSEAEVVYYDNKSSAVYKTYDIDEGIVTHAIRPYEIIRFNAMTGDPNPYHTTNDQTPLLDFLQRIEDSNAIGRTVYTEVVGVTDMGRLLVKQPYIEGLQDLIESDGYTTKKDQTRKAIRDAGFNTFDNPKMWDAAWTRLGDDVFIGVDLHGGNVQLNGDGVPFFVDMPLRKLTEGEQRILGIPEAEAEQAVDEAVSLEQYLKDPDSVEPGEMLDGTFTLPDADFSLQVAETRGHPVFDTRDLVDELFLVFPYDRMISGTAVYNIDGVRVTMKVHGGPDHPFTSGRHGRAGIATRGLSSASRLYNKVLDLGVKYGVIVVGSRTQLSGNPDFAKLYMRVVDKRIQKDKLSLENFLAEANKLRREFLVKKKKDANGNLKDFISRGSGAFPLWDNAEGMDAIDWSDSESVQSRLQKTDWTSTDQVAKALNATSFTVRTEFFNLKGGQQKTPRFYGFKDGIGREEAMGKGLPNVADIFDALEEKDWAHLPAGHAVAGLEFGDNLTFGTARELGFKDHPSYPHNITAVRSGRLSHTFNVRDAKAQPLTKTERKGGREVVTTISAARRQKSLKSWKHIEQNPHLLIERGSSLDPSAAPAVTAIVSNSIQEGSRDPLGMHSPLQRFADSLTQKKMTAEQFRGMAKKNGVKDDELHWTGTDKWLDKHPNFKLDDLLEHLSENRVTLDEVTLNGPSPEWNAYAEEYQEANAKFKKAKRRLGAVVENVAEENVPNDLAMSYGIAAPLAVDRAVRGYKDVALEASALAVVNGVTNVTSRDRKVLKDALMESPEFAQAWQQYLIHSKLVDSIVARKPKNPSNAYYAKDGLTLPGAVNYREVLLHWHGGGPRAFTSGHFSDRENLLAHLRVSDRVLDDGRSALFLEEVQSDWHQKGRDSGYASELPQLKPKELEGMGWSFTKIVEGPLKGKWALRKKTGDGNYASMGTLPTKADAVRKASTLSQAKPEDRGAVADAPFKATWHELLLKRAITMAADGGYDAIAWTTGETQAERSDKLLDASVDRLYVSKDPSMSGTYQVHGYKDGSLAFHEQQHEPDSLRDLIGAKMATESIDYIKQGNEGAEFSGDNLTIGGHGMRVFYDQKLRNAAKKIGKRFKSRPETGSITHPGDVKGEDVQTKVHTLTLTDSMQETAATEGLAQFSIQEGDLGQNSTSELWWMSNKGLSVRRPELRPVPSFGGDPRVKRQAHQDVAEAWQGLVRGYVDHEAGAISVQGPLDNVKWPRPEVDKAARAAMRQLSMMFPDYTVHPMGEVAHGEVAADFALGPSVPDSNFSLGPETRRQAIRRYMQDKFDPIKRLQRRILESGGLVDDQTDVYLYESLFPGKTARDLDTIQRKYVAPLIRAIADSGLGMSRVDELLMARHAKERNERIRDINPDFNTRYYDKDGNPIDPGGSGMPDDVAERIIREAKENGDWAKAQPAMKLLDKLNEAKLKMLVRSGMLSQEAADAMTERFPNYVPLVGHSGETLQPEIAFLSSGPMDAEGAEAVMNVSTTRMSVSEAAVKQALGRTTLAESPIIASVMLANNAAVLARRNEVAQSFLKLVHANPDPEMWEIDKRRTSYYYDKQSGEVRQRDNVMQGQYMKNVVDVRVSGELVSIYVKDPQVVRAMNNIGAAQMPGLVRLMGKAMRLYSALRTQWNPVFVPINLLRDLMTAGIHTKGEIDGAFARKTIKNAFPAMVGIYRYEKWARSEREGKDSKPPEKSLYWVEMLDRMEKAGGRVAFFGLTDFTDKKAEIEAMVKRAERGHKDHSAIQTVKAVGGLISDLNASAENASRLAAFAEAIERGWSDAAAADLARNLTVNFNRKGEVANWMGAFYAFYNASVQGNTRMLQSVVKAKGTRKIALGITAFSAGLSLLNYMFSGEDENGINEWAAMPSSYKARNLIIMLPGGRHIKIPLPWGYNVFHALGTNVMDTITGAQAVKAAGSQTALAVLESFNPIGTSATMTQQVMPTMFEPMVQWEQNTAWHGGPIYKEPMQPGLVPHSRRHFDSASEVSQFMAKSLNDILGGNQFKSGLIDLNPEGIDHLADALFGATGGFVADVISLARKSTGKIAGEPDIELGVRDVPWANKFYGSKREYAAERDFHNLRIAATNAESLLKAYIQSGMTKEAEALKVNKAALIEGRDKLNEVNKLQKSLDTRALVLSELPASKAGRLELLESYVRQLEEKGSDELSKYYRGLSNKALRQPMADIAVAMGVDKDFAERFVTGKMHHNALLSRIKDASGGMSRAEVQAWVKELRDERTKAMKQVAGELRDALDFPARPYPEQER